MGKIIDYTNQKITNKNQIEVQILDLKEIVNGNKIWNYICPYCKEKTFGTISNIKRGDGCSNCRYIRVHNARVSNTTDFSNKLKIQQSNLIVIGDYYNSNTKIKVKCLIHNHIFEAQPINLLNNKYSCKYCLNEHKRDLYQKYDLNYVKTFLYEHNLEFVDETEYQNAATTFSCRCLKCGHISKTSLGSLFDGRICVQCKGLVKKTTEQFKQEIFDLVGDEYTVLGEYVGNHIPILIKHNVCGNEYYVAPTNFLYQNKRCPKCVESLGEKAICSYLDIHQIDYEQEYKFEDCVFIRQLRFDFYLPKYNILIEYQGRQHYESEEFMGGDKDLKLRQERDNIKREYCLKNNIKLIEIPYWNFDNINKILNQKLINVSTICA